MSRMNPPEPESDPNLESWADAQLKELPTLKAPAGLVPQVLQALQARTQRPWYLRVWWDWPLAAKAASLVVGVALAVAFGGGSVLLDQQVAVYSEQVTEYLSPLTGVWELLVTLANAVSLLWSYFAAPQLLVGLAVAGVFYVAFLAVGTLFIRSVYRRV
jgi:hypothetical protein